MAAGLLAVCFWLTVQLIFVSGESWAVSAPGTPGRFTAQSWLPEWKDVLFAGVPFLKSTGVAQTAAPVQIRAERPSVWDGLIYFLTSIHTRDPRTLLGTEIPLLAHLVPPQAVPASVLSQPLFDRVKKPLGSAPLVGIYHTHTSESFMPTSGLSHSPGGTQGDIVAAGEALAQALEQRGIPAMQNKNVHDYPSFMKAYGASEITARRMLADAPSLQAIFDIHRDAGKREYVTATIRGQDAARIKIIVATGQPGLAQTHWQENYAFAQLLEERMDQRYPGLSRGIEKTEWRYNQNLHPHALLLEIGSEESSLAEAQYSMILLGEILAEILTENR